MIGLLRVSLAVLASASVALAKGTGSSSSPNIIFILADDLPWNSGGYGAYGDDSDMSFVTPKLNALSKKGVKMSNYYSQESCSPARGALLTGRYPLSTGMQYGDVDPNTEWGLSLDETIIPQPLQATGDYTTYQLGKWNVGHFTSKLLPVARGFDYYLAYQGGSTMYWSKFHPDGGIFSSSDTKHFRDLTYGDGSCYSSYDGDDMHDYSTFLYRDKALSVIKNHDFKKTSLFMYLAFQAVHDPYEDKAYTSGVPVSYVGHHVYKKVMKKVKGRKRRQMALSLYLLDDAVGKIVDAMEDAGQKESTYFIFTSDNGGCYLSGSQNGPLRGNKGTLFEGGTKVDALIYSAAFSSDVRGSTYGGLFHVTDWLPTIMDMAGVTYKPKDGYELDGVSHWSTILNLNHEKSTSASSGPRSYLLYNYLADIKEFSSSFSEPVRAVRDKQYKLIQAYENDFSSWDDPTQIVEDDDVLSSLGTCTQIKVSATGVYTSYLFDLENDPYETTNLWHKHKYKSIRNKLKSKLKSFYKNKKSDTYSLDVNPVCYDTWKSVDNYIVPWATEKKGEGYPVFKKSGCSSTFISPHYAKGDDDDDFRFVDDDDFEDTKPTLQPTHKPTKH